MATLLSSVQYASHRGVSRGAVTLAIRSKRLVKSVMQVGHTYQIDPEMADLEWEQNTDKTRGAAPKRTARPVVEVESVPAMSFADARARHEQFKARLAELEMEEREGKLVESEATRREAFRVARLVRDSMLNIPDRVSAELAAETNPFKVHKRLTQEIRRSLEEMQLE